MSDYIKLFETVSEFQDEYYGDGTYEEPWVSYCLGNSATTFNKGEYEKLLGTPITFKIISGGTIVWKANNTAYTTTIEYSTDSGETWTSITSNTEDAAPSISVSDGDVVQFRGNNAAYGNTSGYYNSFSGSTARFEVEGNIMSLIDSTGYPAATTIARAFTFCYLFVYCTGLTSAKNLVLPATTLTDSCYNSMFYGCTSLTTAPELPATTLAESCYYNMFRDCPSLTTAPELPAIALEVGCYYGMFYGCTSLTTAPELPATTLASNCYRNMFRSCTSLTQAPSSIGTSATTMANSACTYMFSGCTSLTQAPELPATTLASYCYSHMFYGCTSLTTAPELPATTLTNCCYQYMFENCTGLTTAPELPATTLAYACYYQMFFGCSSLTTAPSILPATTLADYCCRQMFYECSSLTTAPELPATILANNCYGQMFQGCTSLNYIKCLATDISATNCTSSWVNVVASSGTFVKNPNMSSWTTDVSGIPEGWTVQDAS